MYCTMAELTIYEPLFFILDQHGKNVGVWGGIGYAINVCHIDMFRYFIMKLNTIHVKVNL